MKRKALLILAAAILAVAMIPAIGVGAATGDVKIVTPDELANPSGTSATATAFDKLAATQYVSDKTGTVPDTLEDAGGTLYVVIEDNDSIANRLIDYNAFFTEISTIGASGGNLFLIQPGGGGINVARQSIADAVTDSKFNVVTDTAGVDDTGFDLNVGDRSRSGGIDAGDFVFQIGTYNAGNLRTNEEPEESDAQVATFTDAETLPEGSVFLRPRTVGDGFYVTVGSIPSVGATTSEGTVALRVTFASASQNDLVFTAGANEGNSLVQVTSSSGDPIRIPALEKSLDFYAGLEAAPGEQKAGVGPDDFSDELSTTGAPQTDASKDSGVFVARFGVIDNEFKDAIAEYWELVDEPNHPSRTVKVITADAEALENVTELVDGDNTIVIGTPNDDTVGAGLTTTVIVLTGVNKKNTLVAGSLKVVLNNGNDQGEPAVARTGSVESMTISDPHANTGARTVSVGTTRATATDDGDAETNDSADTFTVTYTTEDPRGVIDAMLAVVNATTVDSDNVFDRFCDTGITDTAKQCAEASSLEEEGSLATAVNKHSDNLGIIPATDRVDEFLNNVIGVEHGDTLTVRYSDQSPRSVRTDSAQVDLNGPTIGGFSLADGSYIAEDDFEVLFNVTDTDSGILEDSYDPGEAAIRAGVAYVTQKVLVGVGGDATGDLAEEEGSSAELDLEDELDDGERYELTIDVTHEAEMAEGTKDKDAETVRVKVTITAYDAARNKSTKKVNYVVDTIDPELQEAITGWGVKSRSGDAYVLVENQRDRIALVFDDTIQGDEVNPQDVSVPGSVVLRVTWLSNTGNNKIDVGSTNEGAESATDLDYNAETANSDSADDVVEDLRLRKNRPNQDARHILFLTLDEPLPTGATPTVEIDNNDLIDLAGNENRSDHRAISEDRLAPSFEVTVDQKLSNSGLAVTIIASEALDRRPRASLTLGEDDITVIPSDNGNNNYTVDTDRAGLGIGSSGQQNGVWTFSVTGIDENDNVGTSTAKWELDTLANMGKAPERIGGDADAKKAHRLEVGGVTFLNLEFGAEGDEYGTGEGDDYASTDSSKTVTVTGLTLETLADDDINAKNVAKERSAWTVGTSTDIDEMRSQTTDSVKHVVALDALGQGNYNMKVEYEDAAGNTGTFDYIFQIIAPQPVKVAVNPGWTLVSIPGVPQDSAIDNVLTGSGVTEVWSLNNIAKAWDFARYDSVAEIWEGSLQDMVDGRAYFVRSTTFQPISVLLRRFSPQNTPAMYTVTTGWNSIGYTPAGNETSIEADGYLGALGLSGWGMIRTWNTDSTPPQYETYYSSGAATVGFPENSDGAAIVEAGKGYLLFATRSGSIGG